MRNIAIYSLAALCLSLVVQAHPVTKVHGAGKEHRDHSNLVARQYKAVTSLEDKTNIAIGVTATLVALVSAGIAGLQLTQHLACKAIAQQQKVMQESWDSMHPDGFTPAGDQMRPVSFDCKTQQRPFKPLIPYTNAAEYY